MSTDLEHIERDQAIISVLDRGFDLFNRLDDFRGEQIAALRADVDKLRADLASLMAVLRAGREGT